MHILFADAIDRSGVDRLEAAGHRCTILAELDDEALAGRLADADDVNVLVVRSTPVTAEAIAAAGALELIVRAGAGVNTIDCGAASRRAVFVCNVPGRNAVAVAELTMGLLLAVDRHIADATADARRGRWDKARYSRADGLHGATIAVVGLGAIGLEVAARARAFGMRVLGLRRPGRDDEVQARVDDLGVELVDDLETLLTAADIATIHVPADESTRGLVDDRFLAWLGDDGVLVNTSRGDVVDEAALRRALDRGLRAGLDVFGDEPAEAGAFDHPLAGHPNVVSTHHIGASTRQAQAAVAAGTADVIDAYHRGELLHCVNLETHELGPCSLTVRHLDEVGVLAQVLAVLRNEGLNVQTMQNRIFEGGTAAVATIRLDREPPAVVADRVAAIDEVFSATVRRVSG